MSRMMSLTRTRLRRLAARLLPRRPRSASKRDFLIHITWGGLGDHLFFSHLPRIAKEQGYDRVHVTTRSELRHDDYRLVWTLNPYVDGFVDAEPRYVPNFGEVPDGINLLDRIMLESGLDDGRRLHEPEFFYRPSTLPQYRDKVVYDPNFVSYVGEINVDNIKKYLNENGIWVDYQLQPREKAFALEGVALVETPTLRLYCDLIHSCRRFLCLTSGGATLTAALGKGCTAFHGEGQKPMFHHSRRHTYVLV